MIEEIKSRQNPKVKYANQLKDAGFARKSGKFLVESEHLIEMAKDNLLYVFTTKKLDENLYPNQLLVTEDIMEKLSNQKSPSRVIGVCKVPQPKENIGNLVVYLDNVQDPGNVGTILRSALAFGFSDVLISENSANPFGPKAIQASQGSLFHLNVVNASIDTLKELKNRGYRLISTALCENSVELNKFNFKGHRNYVIILGNEGQGISKEILAISDDLVKIEISGIDSLNVGVAAGIVLYQARR